MMKDARNYRLLTYNTFGIDVRCQRFVEYSSVAEAQILARQLTPADEPLLIVGRGSNLLLTGDFRGTVVHSAIQGVEVTADGDDVLVRAGSGECWDALVARCVEQGWYGMENLSLIPGEVGASAVQNIGAYGAEVASIIDKVETVRLADGQTMTFHADECQYGYRSSRFKHEWRNRYLITYVTYRLARRFTPVLDYGNIREQLALKGIDCPTAQQLRQTVIDIRRQKLPDPDVEGNAGSFFMNPVIDREQFDALMARYPSMPHYPAADGRVKVPAGWLIEQCGWKGRTLGRAGVHSRQALVLVNRGGATGADIVNLCEAIRRDVLEKFGIEISPEVNIV
jgi:UDP-N-acetylmuramate dehydrogenase